MELTKTRPYIPVPLAPLALFVVVVDVVSTFSLRVKTLPPAKEY